MGHNPRPTSTSPRRLRRCAAGAGPGAFFGLAGFFGSPYRALVFGLPFSRGSGGGVFGDGSRPGAAGVGGLDVLLAAEGALALGGLGGGFVLGAAGNPLAFGALRSGFAPGDAVTLGL